VAIYSTDINKKRKNHVRHREFTIDIPEGWKEIKRCPPMPPSKCIMIFYKRVE